MLIDPTIGTCSMLELHNHTTSLKKKIQAKHTENNTQWESLTGRGNFDMFGVDS